MVPLAQEITEESKMAATAISLSPTSIRLTCQCGYVYTVAIRFGYAGSDADFCPECDRPTGLRDLPR